MCIIIIIIIIIIIVTSQTVFENKVLRRIFGPKRGKVAEEWRKLNNEEPNDLYCSPNIVRVMKSKRMGWAGRVALMGREEAYTRFWWENLRKKITWKTQA